MDKSKQAAFVKAMGKKRSKFSKGGMIRKVANRKYYDDGGNVTKLSGPSSASTVNNAVNPNTGVLGSIGGALGLNNNFVASSANIQQGTNAAQLNDAYTGAQGGIQAQQGLANTLAPQAAGAVANQQAVADQQLGIMNGTGPNPALAQLNQTTGRNVANQAALMAGQRGSAQNVGLLARQAGMQGAATQQEAAGQGASLAAQQQIGAAQNLANLSNQQVAQAGSAVTGYNTAQQNEQNILQNANTSGNNAAVGMQSNINNVNAATAAGNQNMMGNIMGGVGSAVSAITGGLFAKGGEVEADHHIQLAEMNSASLNHAKKFANGGDVSWGGQYTPSAASSGPNIAAPVQLPSAPQTKFSDVVSGLKKKPDDPNAPKPSKEQTDDEAQQGYLDANADLSAIDSASGVPMMHTVEAPASSFDAQNLSFAANGGMMGEPMKGKHESHVANFLFAKGGAVPAMVSPGEIYLNPAEVDEVVSKGANPLKMGKRVPGQPKVKGDSLKNDVVPATLEEGGVVLPRSIAAKKKMSPEKAAQFVHRAVKKKQARK